MANPKSKRQSRKRRSRGGSSRATQAGRAGASAPAERVTPAQVRRVTTRRAPATPFGPYGERPPNLFGGVPVSEIAILAGGVGIVVGLLSGGGLALIVGAAVCGLGVLEVTVREHFSGYRSHTVLLAALPTVLFETALVLALGEPSNRLLLLPAIAPVFAGLFWLLRKRFLFARQARIARLS